MLNVNLKTHTHTLSLSLSLSLNQLNITNQFEMTCQSDHVNEGCAPKKKKNIKNEFEGSERFFP